MIALLVLRTPENYFYVCTAYNTQDAGRCEVLAEDRTYFAQYHELDGCLEYKKTSTDAEIVVKEQRWPAGVSTSRKAVLDFYGFPH